MSAADDRIEADLDELTRQLAGRTPHVRRVVTEMEAHLHDLLDAGVDVDTALARFGSAEAIARRYRQPLARQLLAGVIVLATVGLLAIGASGVVSLGMRAAFGDHFLAADVQGVTYTATRCADFERFHPEVSTCDAAATAHHADEVVDYRIAAGVLGLAALGAWFALRRRLGAPPRPFVATTGAAVFGLAAAGLAVQAVNQYDGGAGQWLSAALVSVVVAGAFARTMVRELSAA